ncbi:hypothetical protein [Flavobacterium pectinovorum]|uniref:Uncharacterized protein n=1 Tax=Flavobacterium pectinovorum TaxID=29533 RepID=A0AB36P0Y8_9FLAO|nr:hypothetical protein [Flavobacterium pectinovorum]OXB04976.1 hypothetical protein B0A72_10895 [Flavobacterium pectinovorum]SHL32878.1 hypothetical protein SAMN05444387_0333 [Flavobacterium pectinovorum]
MRLFLLFNLFLFQSTLLFAQSDAKYHGFADRISQFSKPNKVLYKHIDAQGNGPIEYTNAKKQILRFRVLNHKLQILHGGIAYQLFIYENNYLQKMATFDSNGKLAGERESQNEAIVEFIVEKKEEYLRKKKILDDAEGNIDMKDDSQEQIIRIKLFDSNNRPIIDLHSKYISSKEYYNYCHRMYWP